MTTANFTDGVPLREVPGRTAPVRRGRAFLLVPLVLVNSAAVWGQAGWALTNLRHGLLVAVLFAMAIESVGIYLAWESHEALMSDQASGTMRNGSYAIGILAGTLNYLHFRPESVSTGIAFGALSAISPWLWAIWSRARNRTRLAEMGLTDVRGVKLSTVRKLLHPVKSFQVVRWAAWESITDPREAVQGWELTRNCPGTVPEPVDPGTAKRDLIREMRRREPEVSTQEIAKVVGVSDRWVRKVLAA